MICFISRIQKLLFIIGWVFFASACSLSTEPKDKMEQQLTELFDKHQFQKARVLMDSLQVQPVTASLQDKMTHYADYIHRFNIEFPYNRKEIMRQIKEKGISVDNNRLLQWEEAGWLEYMEIDGEKRYFKNGVRNLLLLNDSLHEVTGVRGLNESGLSKFRICHIKEILKASAEEGFGKPVLPVGMQLDYTLIVKPNVVPPGRFVHVWMPFGVTNHPRQPVVECLKSEPPCIPSCLGIGPHHSIPLNQQAVEDEPLHFFLSTRLVTLAQYFDPLRLREIEFAPVPDSIKAFTVERPPHLAFTEDIRSLADSITTPGMRPYEMVRQFYYWINDHIPWASAIEYGLLANIPEYTLRHRHGDCGMQTMLFMALCRYKGIPARWQSGWMLHPEHVNLHDWCEVWYSGVGWVPVDVSFKLQDSENLAIREFYISGIDAYRFIVNTDYGGSFVPAKDWPRSEPVDFQRGEVEWEGGNLYFDQWSWDMEVRRGES